MGVEAHVMGEVRCLNSSEEGFGRRKKVEQLDQEELLEQSVKNWMRKKIGRQEVGWEK